MLKIYNTLSRKVEEFSPLNDDHVGLYTCGPTVYDYTHIGHFRRYLGDELLKKVLKANGLGLKHVMNITDVGHLTSDADEGDDKLEKGARERQMSVWETAKYFEDYFWKSLDQLGYERPDVVCRATEHIGEQLKLIEKLESKGYTYQTDQAIYFDTAKFPDYTKLSRQKLEEKNVGSRGEVVVDRDKRNPQDFALWFFTVGHFANHTMRWPSKWGEGFPGWHIECSAMSMEYLGDSFDIHTGGIDHISVHHTNEIAQSEAATGKPFVKYWVHHGMLILQGEKMSKSKKNNYRVEEIVERSFDPRALKYLFYQTHYRDQLDFSWEALEAAQNALTNLRETIRDWAGLGKVNKKFDQKFIGALNNDLNCPQALAVLWEMVKSDIPDQDKSATLLKFDQVLGLELDKYLGKKLEVPRKVQDLLDERELARKHKDFKTSDELRHQIKKLGFELEDTPSGVKVKEV